MILYEENIVRIVKKFNSALIPETSYWNPAGISEEEAQVIAQKNDFKLETLSSAFLPEFHIFKFLVYSEKRFRQDKRFECSVCKSKGFEPSTTGNGCTFCDGTEGGVGPDWGKEENL